MQKVKTILTVLITLLILIIILQNTQAVQTKLLFVTVTMPRALLLIVVFLIGFAGGAIVAFNFARKTKKQP